MAHVGEELGLRLRGLERLVPRLREFGGPEALRLEEVPTPRPGPGEVLIRVANVSVNVTLDIAVRKAEKVKAEKPADPA